LGRFVLSSQEVSELLCSFDDILRLLERGDSLWLWRRG
jgi:hypothetical protein